MVTKWININEPWFEIDGFIKALVDKVSILGILDKYGVEYSPSLSGEFSHKARCPLPAHMDGDERTASFFISEEKNNFYCFGCNSGHSVIDFVSLYLGKPFYESVKLLTEQSGLTIEEIGSISDKKIVDPEKLVSTHTYRTGVFVRNYLASIKNKPEYKKRCIWSDKLFLKLDSHLNELDDDKWEVAKAYHDKVITYIKGRLM